MNRENARRALAAGLYVSTGTFILKHLLRAVADDRADYPVELFEVGGEPVGVLLVYAANSNRPVPSVYVKKAYRRQGIASALLERLGPLRKKLRAGPGIEGAVDFWKHNDVRPLGATAYLSKNNWVYSTPEVKIKGMDSCIFAHFSNQL